MSFIDLQEAQDMIAEYQSQRPNLLKEDIPVEVLPLSITFERAELLELLENPAAEKMRVYFGITDPSQDYNEGQNLINLVLVAVDENDEDIIDPISPVLIDRGARCPTLCPPTSVLNP